MIAPITMPDKTQPDNWRRIIIYAACALAVALFAAHVLIAVFAPSVLHVLRAFRGILPPFIIAVALAFLLDPFVDALQRKRVPRLWSALIIFLSFAMLLTALGAVLVPIAVTQANELAANVPAYYDSVSKWFTDLTARARPLLQRFHLPTTPSGFADRFSKQIQSALSAVGLFLVSGFSQFVGNSVWFVLIILLTFMLLKDLDDIQDRLLSLLPHRYRTYVTTTANDIGNVFVRYLRGMIIVCTLYGLIAAILFAVLGLQYSLLIGITAGVLYAIPYIGAFLTSLIVLLVALFQHPEAIYLAFVFTGITIALNQVFDMIVTPRIVGGAVGLHPVISIFALMFGGAAFGVVGMLLAVPVAGSIQLILSRAFPKLAQSPDERPAKRGKPKEPKPPKE